MRDVMEGRELYIDAGSMDTTDQVADKLEDARDSAADALEGAASTLQEKSGTYSGVSHIARNLGVQLEAAAYYVRRFDAREFISETKECARKYPAAWLTVSLAVGWSLRRR
jgi:hypothetical protein